MRFQHIPCFHPNLIRSPHAPAGSTWYYGLAVPFQVAPRLAGLMVNLRDVGERGGDHVDFETGCDAILFDRLDTLGSCVSIPVSRNHTEGNPRAGGDAGIMVKYPVQIGFVPQGALREDGSPHPHAGTGFGLCQAVCWPVTPRERRPDGSLRPFGGEQSYVYTELCQFRYDGQRFHVSEPRRVMRDSDWLDGHQLGFVGFTMPVPDGDDLLFPMHGRRNGQSREQLGMARWQRVDGTWRPTAWHLVADPDDQHGEMSMVRDTDGSLLYSARPNTALTCHNMHIWRSTDNGESWADQLKVQWIRSAAPVTINLAADGTPIMLANLYETPLIGTADPKTVPVTPTGWKVVGGYRRDKLYAWPLSEDRRNLDAPILVRDCPADFGPPPGGSTWSADHALALPLRLGDGQWHTIVTYRVLERGENGMHCPATPYTGCFVEEIVTSNAARPLWRWGCNDDTQAASHATTSLR